MRRDRSPVSAVPTSTPKHACSLIQRGSGARRTAPGFFASSQLVGSDPHRQSLYARLSSGTNEKALLLLHHIDVVPVAQSEWTKPAFGGVTQGGYLFGRGALDIKSLGIAELMSLIEIKRRN